MNVNLPMVKAGLAEAYKNPPAKGFNRKLYMIAEQRTRNAGINMWSQGDNIFRLRGCGSNKMNNQAVVILLSYLQYCEIGVSSTYLK
jgi:endonuclease YncB( thermonuclease family)